MGSEIYQRISGTTIEVSLSCDGSKRSGLTVAFSVQGATDFTCSALRVDAPWWRATIPQYYCESLLHVYRRRTDVLVQQTCSLSPASSPC